MSDPRDFAAPAGRTPADTTRLADRIREVLSDLTVEGVAKKMFGGLAPPIEPASARPHDHHRVNHHDGDNHHHAHDDRHGGNHRPRRVRDGSANDRRRPGRELPVTGSGSDRLAGLAVAFVGGLH